MDENRMTGFAFAHLPLWSAALSLVLHLAGGLLLGMLYFRGVWWNARRFAAGGRVAATIALSLGRFAVLGGCLTLASLEGPLPLLVMALGVLIARPLVVRHVEAAA